MITNNISTLKIHKMTQAQYERELAAGNIDENALYLTPDEARDLSLYLMKDEAEQEYESQISAQEKLNEAKEYAETVILAVTKEMGESKADKEHHHDEMYYTEDEVDELLANKKGNDFIVTISGDETSGYIADKTYAEITQAYNDGRTCILIDVDGSILTLTSLSKLYASFALLGSYSSRVVLVTAENKVIIKTTQFVKDEENPSLATSNKTIIGAINELDAGLDNHKHSIEDIEGFNSSVDSAILYTEQELTDEQRAQARQNIAKMQYDWREVPCAGLGAVHKIADSSMYYGTSPTLDIDGAISLTSVSSAKYSAIGYLHGAVEFLLMSTDIGTQISLFMPRILSEYNLICNSGLLNGNYLYMCQESDTSDEIELLYVMSPNNTNGFTHSITIAKCSNYVGEGRIYYNEATGDYQIAMSARKHTDDTLTLVDYPADAKAVGDALATKITGPVTATVGQTIVVKSVDENGKPTEWEAVDFTGGGGGYPTTGRVDVLASGTIAAGTDATVAIDTGITYADVKNYDWFEIGIGVNTNATVMYYFNNISTQPPAWNRFYLCKSIGRVRFVKVADNIYKKLYNEGTVIGLSTTTGFADATNATSNASLQEHVHVYRFKWADDDKFYIYPSGTLTNDQTFQMSGFKFE